MLSCASAAFASTRPLHLLSLCHASASRSHHHASAQLAHGLPCSSVLFYFLFPLELSFFEYSIFKYQKTFPCLLSRSDRPTMGSTDSRTLCYHICLSPLWTFDQVTRAAACTPARHKLQGLEMLYAFRSIRKKKQVKRPIEHLDTVSNNRSPPDDLMYRVRQSWMTLAGGS